MNFDRYSRQIRLKVVGEDGQERLHSSNVLIIGCGALGTIIADHLVRAGVGVVKIIARDMVELNNLQRQIIFDETDVGMPKAIAARSKLSAINSDIRIEAYVEDLHQGNVEEFLRSCDIVIDGTDNLITRMVVNAACVKNGIPWIFGGAVETKGMVMGIKSGGGPCLRCLFPKIPPPGIIPGCDTVGVLNTLTAVVGSIEATEALKFHIKGVLSQELITVDIWKLQLDHTIVERNSSCICCVHEEFEFLQQEMRDIVTTLCGRDAVQIRPARPIGVSFEELAERLSEVGEVRWNEYLLSLRGEGVEASLFRDGRAIIKGVKDQGVARSIYTRYFG